MLALFLLEHGLTETIYAPQVGYMAGPLAVIVDVCNNPANNVVTNNAKVMPEIWIILIGAFGLVVGLATYGYKVCGSIGTQMARITPSRGFSAELATSFVIMVSAQWGLPTSSSQCITGEDDMHACMLAFRWACFSRGINHLLSTGLIHPHQWRLQSLCNVHAC
jgi:hypothetical protein